MNSRPVIAGIGEMLWDVYPTAAHFGGAPANFACHASSPGAEAWMVGAAGADELGHRAVAALQHIASAVKLNDDELPIVAELCGVHATTPREMLIELTDTFELRLAVLTRGPRGSLLIAGSEEDECAAPAATVVDTVGAGDAFTATLVSGFLRGLPLAAINRHANAVAAFVCSQSGATPSLPAHLLNP